MAPTDARPEQRRILHAVAVVAPIVTCLFCPVCLPAGIGVLSALGIGVLISEEVHRWLIATAMAVALVSAALLAWRHKTVGAFGVTVVGSAAVILGCIVYEIPILEYAGTALIVAAAVWNWRLRFRRLPRLFRIQSRPAARSS